MKRPSEEPLSKSNKRVKPTCTFPGCDSSVVKGNGLPDRCILHGGGYICTFPGCDTTVQKGNGLPDRCIRHGGGWRCQVCCLYLDHPALATGRHPDTKVRMCTQAMRQVVIEAPTDEEKLRFNKAFGFKKSLINRPELIFYHALNKEILELRLSERVLDESVLRKVLGKQKALTDPRPDYFHYMADNIVTLAMLGEFDEKPGHEDDDDRLDKIFDMSGCGKANGYVFRVMANQETERELCKRRIMSGGHVYFELTQEGQRVVIETIVVVRRILGWIAQGLPPSDEHERPRKTYINF